MASLEQLNAVAAQVAALTARLDQTAAELQSSRAENAQLKNILDSGVAAIPALAQGVQDLVTTVAASSAPRTPVSLLDTRGLGKPSVYEDKEERFVPWSHTAENFAAASLGESFRQVLDGAAERDTASVASDWHLAFGDGTQDEVPDVNEKVAQLHTVLVALTDSESNDIVIGAGIPRRNLAQRGA